MEDIFTIANKNFNSRLIVGTGKYKNLEETARKSCYFQNQLGMSV